MYMYVPLQAAAEQNPFLLDDPGVSSAAVVDPRKIGPPGRPPPPSHMASASPAKSAFDDLNDTIRAAMGNSPAKPALNTSGQPLGTQPQPPNPAGSYAGAAPPFQQPSPAKNIGLDRSLF